MPNSKLEKTAGTRTRQTTVSTICSGLEFATELQPNEEGYLNPKFNAVKTKLKNMKDGGIIEKTFRADENVEQAFIDKKQFQYLYSEAESFIFMNNETKETPGYKPIHRLSPQEIKNEKIESKCGWSPFNNVEFKGTPVATIIAGKTKMKDGKILGEPEGTPLEFN